MARSSRCSRRSRSPMSRNDSMNERMAGAFAPPTVRTLVAELEAMLARGGITAAGREARDIVASVLDVPRFWPSMHPDVVMDADSIAEAKGAANRRARGAPFAYAVRRAAFRHLTLQADERVLIPRVETEELVEVALALRCAPGGLAVDIGTGSGAIALALATEARFDRVIGTDISGDAIAVARTNAATLGRALRAPVEFRIGSLLRPVSGVRARLLCANLP